MAPGCTQFYLVQSGDTCSSIVTKYGITAAEFDGWNPAVGTNCATGVWLGYYYCISNTTSSILPPGGSPSFYSTPHAVTAQPQPTAVSVSAPIPPLPFSTGPPPPPGDCGLSSLDPACGSSGCGLFGCGGGCGLFGCDGGCGLFGLGLFCGGGCSLGGCGPGCGTGESLFP
jgi:hypothetical protein